MFTHHQRALKPRLMMMTTTTTAAAAAANDDDGDGDDKMSSIRPASVEFAIMAL